jgi:hypothetical protein
LPLLPSGAADLLDSPGDAGQAARAALAQDLKGVYAGAGELSDRLSRRYFALIEPDVHALAT